MCQLSLASSAQKKYEFGQGLRYTARDSSFHMKFSVRVQNRFDGQYMKDANPEFDSRFYIKRGRTKFDGFVITPKLKYKLEFDVVGGYVRDAYLKWNLYKNVSVLYGLAKLPGNLERVVSSQKLEFVDRSLMNAAYNIDRDNGVQVFHHWNMGEVIIREVVAYTHGRGINDNSYNDGASYTGRLEILPLGNFADKGEFSFVDFRREPTPKIMLGGTYNLNDEAIKSNGQLGERLSDDRDLSTVFADFIFKYRGIGAFGEFSNKSTIGGSPVIATDTTTGDVTESFYTGYGYNAHLSYLFKSQWQIGGRYTVVIPEQRTQRDQLVEYTLGLSKYINQHSLKVQSEISYLETTSYNSVTSEKLYFRMQVELSF